MYATGLGYRADKVKGMTGSWQDLGDADSGGRSFMLDDFQEGIGMANLVNGFDLNTTDEDELEQSKDYLVDLKPKLRGISSDPITNMTSGNAWLHHLWNGDIVNIRNQVDNPEDFKFQKNDEGIPVGSDTFAIPVNAQPPGHRPALHRVHARAGERRPERGVRGLPDALRAAAPRRPSPGS